MEEAESQTDKQEGEESPAGTPPKLPADATGVHTPEVRPTEEGKSSLKRLNKKKITVLGVTVVVLMLVVAGVKILGGGDKKAPETEDEEVGQVQTEVGEETVARMEDEQTRAYDQEQAAAASGEEWAGGRGGQAGSRGKTAGPGGKPADKEAELKGEQARKMKQAEALQKQMEAQLKEKEEEQAKEEGEDPWEKARKSAQRRRAQAYYQQAFAARGASVFASPEEAMGEGDGSDDEGSSAEDGAEDRAQAYRDQMMAFEDKALAAVAQQRGPRTKMAGQDEKREFLEKPRQKPTQNVHRLQDAPSPYVVQAGTMLPLVLETGVSSDLPGFLKARFARPVYDTVTGEHLLIPAGAFVVGEYSSKVEFGQSRVQVVWTRLLLPNGKSMKLGSLPGTDLAGRTGNSDQVDRHYDQLAAGTLLSSALAAGAGAAAGPRSGIGETTPQQAALGAAGENVSEVGEEIVEKQLEVQPTIRIRPGMRVGAFVHEDLVLEPYESVREGG